MNDVSELFAFSFECILYHVYVTKQKHTFSEPIRADFRFNDVAVTNDCVYRRGMRNRKARISKTCAA